MATLLEPSPSNWAWSTANRSALGDILARVVPVPSPVSPAAGVPGGGAGAGARGTPSRCWDAGGGDGGGGTLETIALGMAFR